MSRDLRKKGEFMGRCDLNAIFDLMGEFREILRDTTNSENTFFPPRFSAGIFWRVCQRTESIVTLVFVVINCVIAACVFECSGHLVWRHGSFLARSNGWIPSSCFMTKFHDLTFVFLSRMIETWIRMIIIIIIECYRYGIGIVYNF